MKINGDDIDLRMPIFIEKTAVLMYYDSKYSKGRDVPNFIRGNQMIPPVYFNKHLRRKNIDEGKEI